LTGLIDKLTHFTTVPSPQITSYTPTSGPLGTRMKIVGNKFGSSTGKVYFAGSSQAQIVSWSDTVIKCIVWTGAVSGEFYVRTSGGVNSNTGYCTVTQPSTIYVHAGSPQDIENGTQTWPFNLQTEFGITPALENLVYLPGTRHKLPLAGQCS
jgi:IPT/TIG domain